MQRCWCGNVSLSEYSERYCKCSKCKTLVSKYNFQSHIYDIENEEQDLYGKNYWEVSMINAAGKSTLSEVIDMYLTERVIYWLKYVLKYVKLGASLAEVGCGLGQLQYVLNRLDYKQLAFELSPDICNYMESELKISTNSGSFVEKKNAYDAILAFDLFEHLMEPSEFLQACSNSLKENGVLCFQTPCYDSQLSYEEMQEVKSRFEEQLKAEQHIYLYSKESITNILEKYGFNNIYFEPAFFGDDYDMFLFASKMPIQVNSDKEIDDYLNAVDNGRLIKAMLTLFDKSNKLNEQYFAADNDRNVRLVQNEKLEKMLQESEADRVSRKEQIGELSRMLQESEADRVSRKEQIDELNRMLQESETDRVARKEQIDELSRMLQESEADRVARKEQIDELSRMLQESEADRVARKEQIDELSRMLQESELDRAARLDQIVKLTKMINEIKQI